MRQGRPNSLQKWWNILLWNFFDFGKLKKTLTEKVKMVTLSVDGTVTSGKDRLLKYQKNIMKKYQQLGVEENSILSCSGKDIYRYHVNAITFLDHEMMCITFDLERIVAIFSLTLNSVGIEANFSIAKT